MRTKEQSEYVRRSFQSRRTVDRKAWTVEENHGLDLVERLENVVMSGACLTTSVERVVLQEERREPRDAGG